MQDKIQVMIITSIGPYSCQLWPETGGWGRAMDILGERQGTLSITGRIKTDPHLSLQFFTSSPNIDVFKLCEASLQSIQLYIFRKPKQVYNLLSC